MWVIEDFIVREPSLKKRVALNLRNIAINLKKWTKVKKMNKKMNLYKQNYTINDRSIISAAKEQISSDLGKEAIILNLKSGMYHGLNEVAAQVWDIIQQPKAVKEVKAMLLEEYEVDIQQCDRDLKDLLGELTEAGLIDIRNETAA